MKNQQSGFTLIELLMVIILVGILNAVAIPSFIDFRTEAKIAQTQQALQAIRIAYKLKKTQAFVTCGISPTPPFPAGWMGGTFINALFANWQYNDITYYSGIPIGQLCTTAQVPNAGDRLYMSIGESDKVKQYWLGTYYSTFSIPKNPFHARPFGFEHGFTSTDNASIILAGGRCGYATAGSQVYHWVMITDTEEIFPGTNTPGVNECNF